MEKILFLTTANPSGSLTKQALEALNLSVSLNNALPESELVVGITGPDAAKSAESIGGCGASRFIAVEGEEFTQPRYSTDAAAFEALARAAEASIVIAPATSRFNRALSGVAARLDGRTDTHVTNVEVADEKVRIQRWLYRQRIAVTGTRNQRPWFLLIEPGVGSPFQSQPSNVEIEKIQVDLPDECLKTTVSGEEKKSAAQDTIRPDAALLLVAGAGWTRKQADGEFHAQEAERLIRGFLDATGASLGSSKSLVDLGGEGQPVLPFLTHMNQIGQTGSTPRHKKGLATCCHGEEPHTVGWRFIKERRAINSDTNCGWAHGKADVVYVADAFKVLNELNKRLAE
ncbi:MAG: FAD-binding protein [Verrucomicrobia bacterium]|nr:FAD-binding protein [Verrucomicrobiota bacterium]MCF7707957.1 FAD-binding protein [Verrucomicrobiota bacterium]